MKNNSVFDYYRGKEGKINLVLSVFLLAALIMAVVVAMEVTPAYAKENSALKGRSISEYGNPWVLKSDGHQLAFVRDEDTGELVALGLKIKYCRGVAAQQEASVHNLITVERAPLRAYRSSSILTAPEAVERIAYMNNCVAATQQKDNKTGDKEKESAEEKTIPGNQTGDVVKAPARLTEEADIEEEESADSQPPVTVALNKVIKEEKPIKYKTKVIKTDQLVRGQKEVKVEGENGSKTVVSDVVMENGHYAGSTVLDSEVTEKAVTKIIYEGTRLSTRDKGELLVQYATRFLGTKYVLGGADERKGIDCSGFTMRMYGKLGITLPHYSYDQEHCGVDVKYKDAQPGDLILYPGHVGIYMGNNKMIHATPGEVKITDDCRYRKMTCVRRIFKDDDGVTQEMFDKLFEDKYNEGAEEIATAKLSELGYYTMSDEYAQENGVNQDESGENQGYSEDGGYDSGDGTSDGISDDTSDGTSDGTSGDGSTENYSSQEDNDF